MVKDRRTDASDMASPPEGMSASVIFRVMRVLELLATQTGGVSVREAARRTGIDRSAISRLLVQLEKLGFARKDVSSHLYRPSAAFFGMAAAVRSQDSLWEAARPLLKVIVDRHEETSYLTVLHGFSVVFQEKIECRQPVRYVVGLGEPFKLTTGVAGLAILSVLPDDMLDQVLAEPIPQYTARTTTDPVLLRAELKAFRSQGYAVSMGRWTRDGGGVAAPYFNAYGECAGAVAVSGPAARLTPDRIPGLAQSVVEASRQLTRRLGWLGEIPPDLSAH